MNGGYLATRRKGLIREDKHLKGSHGEVRFGILLCPRAELVLMEKSYREADVGSV